METTEKSINSNIWRLQKKFIITGRQHSWHVLIKLQLQQNTGFYNYGSNFQVLKALKATENLGHSAAVYRIAKKH